MENDPNEWTNLAGNPDYAAALEEMRRWAPKTSKKPVPGSAARILTYDDGEVIWEGNEVLPTDPIPEM